MLGCEVLSFPVRLGGRLKRPAVQTLCLSRPLYGLPDQNNDYPSTKVLGYFQSSAKRTEENIEIPSIKLLLTRLGVEARM